jgi:hypothetical protein
MPIAVEEGQTQLVRPGSAAVCNVRRPSEPIGAFRIKSAQTRNFRTLATENHTITESHLPLENLGKVELCIIDF